MRTYLVRALTPLAGDGFHPPLVPNLLADGARIIQVSDPLVTPTHAPPDLRSDRRAAGLGTFCWDLASGPWAFPRPSPAPFAGDWNIRIRPWMPPRPPQATDWDAAAAGNPSLGVQGRLPQDYRRPRGAAPMRTYLGRTFTPRGAQLLWPPTGRPGLLLTTYADDLLMRSEHGAWLSPASLTLNDVVERGGGSDSDSDDTSTRATRGDYADHEELEPAFMWDGREWAADVYALWWDGREWGRHIVEEVD